MTMAIASTETESFQTWFKNSKAIDESGKPQIFYHGSTQEFTTFDINKIKADETDAVYNGFWFTSEKDNASPAFRDAKHIKAFYLSIQNPAPHAIIREVYKELKELSWEEIETRYPSDKGFRSGADIMRYELETMGYDGVIFEDKAEVNKEALQAENKAYYRTVRGTKYMIRNDGEYGGIDLYKVNGEYEEHITGYMDYDDFISQWSERVFIVFKPNQIKSIDNTGTWNCMNDDTRY